MLREAVLNHITTNFADIPSDVRIVVKIYGNLKSLGEVCYRAGLIDRISKIQEFAVGFTQGMALSDFVDVGLGKDHTEAKIIGKSSVDHWNAIADRVCNPETFQLYSSDYHCRQIFIGGARGSGYVQFLQESAADLQALNKLTLLEDFVCEEHSASLPFETVKFDDLFRDSKMNPLPQPSGHRFVRVFEHCL